MATKRSNGDNNGRSPVTVSASEPIAARILQALILVAGVTLLLSVLLGGRWGPLLVGILILVTALPPLRGAVDRWLVGSAPGRIANQAALIRLALGAAIAIMAIIGVFRF